MHSSNVAVVDIGSNSIRMVIYDGLKRTPLPLFNEKVLCGLARDMEQTKKLNAEGAKLAFDELGRFAELLKVMNIKKVKAFATSAVRDAQDGKAFITKVKRAHGFDIRVLSGEEEAEFAAIGILASMDEVSGIVGDYGGGSLELADIKSGTTGKFSDYIGDKISFPIGALRLRTLSNRDKKVARTIVESQIRKFSLEEKLKDRDFYAIGGSFRALAKYHIIRTGHPLSVVHQYKVRSKKLLTTIKYIAQMNAEKIKKIPDFSASRSDTVTYAAVVMQAIIEIGKPRNIVFSAHGVREGLLASELPVKEQKKDALLEGATEMIKHISPEGNNYWVDFGHELHNWMTPLFRKETPEITRLRLVACILSGVAWHEHTAYRAEMAFRWITDAALPAIDHAGRAFVGSCVFHRYQTDRDPILMDKPQSLLEKKIAYRAQVIGNAMRLGYAISGGAMGILPKVPLTLDHDDNLMIVPEDKNHEALIGNLVRSRLEKLASVTGLKIGMKI